MNPEKSHLAFILPSTSQYDVLHHFTEKIYESFVRKGFPCTLVSAVNAFNEINKDKFDLTIGINGVPFNEDRKMLSDITGIPHVCYLIDPPFRFYELLSSKNIIYTCDDAYNVEFLKLKGQKRSFFMPHGVDISLSNDPIEEKKYDLVFMGTFIDFEAIRKKWVEQFPKILSQVLDDAVEITFGDGETSLIQAFSKAYQERLGLEKECIPIDMEFMLPLTYLEMYIKGKERFDLLSTLSFFPIHIFGSSLDKGKSWKEIFSKKKNIVVHPEVPFEEAIKIMKQTRILLNASSKNKEGGHERIFYGMGCGAVVLTNENKFMSQNFVDEKNILFYQTNNFSPICDKILKLMNNSIELERIAIEGRNEVFKNHTWDKRMEVFLPYI